MGEHGNCSRWYSLAQFFELGLVYKYLLFLSSVCVILQAMVLAKEGLFLSEPGAH